MKIYSSRFFKSYFFIFLTALAVYFIVLCSRGAPVYEFLNAEEINWLQTNRDSLKVLFGYQAAPEAFTNENGEYVGIWPDYQKVFEEMLGFPLPVKMLPSWSALLEHAKTHQNFIIIGIAPAQERVSYLHFTDPLLKIPYVVVTRTNSKIKKMSDLKSLRVCTTKDYSVNEYIHLNYREIKPTEVEHDLLGLRGVSTGQFDAMIVGQHIATFLVEKEGLANLQIVCETGYLNRLGAAVSVKDPMLYRIIDKVVDHIPGDTRRDLFYKWISPQITRNALPIKILTIIIGIAIVVGILLGMLWIWSMTLRKKVAEQTRQIREDMQKMRAIQEELHQSEEKYRQLIENLRDGFFVYCAGKIEICNPRFFELFKMEQLSLPLPFHRFLEVVDAVDRKAIEEILEDYKSGKALNRLLTCKISGPEKTAGYLEIQFHLVNLQGRHCLQGMVRDVSERYQLEEQLVQAQKMEAVGRLAGGVAHDFNNLLTVINGHADLLLHKLEENDSTRNALLQIAQAGRRAADLVKQLLAFSRKQIFQPRPTQINDLINSLKMMMERMLGENIFLSTSLQPDLSTVYIDPNQLEQVLLNLLINARDAMPNGGDIRISTRTLRVNGSHTTVSSILKGGDWVEIEVRDSGHGIEPEILPHIFEPFFTTKGLAKGTGLGLATVYGIVKQSNGEIRVESTPGKGTAFYLYFPVYDLPKVAEKVEETEITKTGAGAKILLVEDSEDVRRLIEDILKDAGYTVSSVGNGREALALPEEELASARLLLTDVVMPEMTGKELADALSARNIKIPVLYMSGYTSNVVSHHGILDEGTNFIRKPFKPRELLYKIQHLLES
ncbi:MAG: hypothetical protein Kow0037_26580 [Calditrichia bacterium]